jgi:hypothetical protein
MLVLTRQISESTCGAANHVKSIETMETKDRISVAALLVSIIALTVAIGSAFFSGKQYFLNAARDQREREARLPTFDHTLVKQHEGRLWSLKVDVVNRNDAKLTFDFAAIGNPEGAKLALPDGAGGHLNPVGAIPKFIADGVPPHATASWTGFIVIDDQFPGGRGKQAEITYAFRFIDADMQIERSYAASLP